ncbi:DUF3046 domain-containing protein [Hoyosella rhizosphaerae]|uniref:DUF3046 domain-containing protein n=1 Tax=Hoyosella rhizosphaerae TaxID=1755582 RepID=UPI001664A645|nr:DUF3046 domain-containing protein [Hoyosella rhizosphaerae]MBN4926333.1 DUF3046 domain-containing protein [Hoyosella rhizosphaerae]
MRLTEFHNNIQSVFGPAMAPTVLRDHVLASLGGITAERAVEKGVGLRDVWWALCSDFDVPRDKW